MNENIEKNLHVRVKEFLQIDEECSLFELFERLREYRNSIHPDKFQDEETKKEAEEKFKEAQNLWQELKRAIEREKLEKKSTEIQYYKSVYENVDLIKELDEARIKISELDSKIVQITHERDGLEKELSEKQTELVEEEFKKIESIYKPTKLSLASLGISTILVSLLAIFSQVESVAEKIRLYSPFSDSMFNIFIFGVFILLLVINLKKYIELNFIKRKATQICSPKIVEEFRDFLFEKYSNKERGNFSELDVFKFLENKSPAYKKYLPFSGIRVYDIETIDNLKNVFINNLIMKKLITISVADELVRTFTIKMKDIYWHL
jgi:hypothetical protein